MRREASFGQRHDWWIMYGLILRGFVTGGNSDGVTHWMAECERTDLVIAAFCPRLCSMTGDYGDEFRPDGVVDCVACLSLDLEGAHCEQRY